MGQAARLISVVFISVSIITSGCSDGMSPDVQVNQAPETVVYIATPQTLDEEHFEVQLSWEGMDRDGSVVAFEYLLVEPQVPKGTIGDDENWIRTVDQELQLVLPTSAATAETGLGYAFWVRAIDDRGVADPSPAATGFSAVGVAPTVSIQAPVSTGDSCADRPPVLSFEWLAFDVDSKDSQGLQTRYALVAVEELTAPDKPALDPGTCLSRSVYESMDPIPWFAEESWSPWIDYAHDDLPSRSATLPAAETGEVLLFVVQARDADGNKMRIFPWLDAARSSRINPNVLPVLEALEPHFGKSLAPSTTLLRTSAGVSHQIHWNAHASEYRGEITGYRYGWNLLDPDDPDDPAWTIWDPDLCFTPPQTLGAGSHTFTLEARDNSGGVARLSYHYEIAAVPPRSLQKDLLLIMDTGLSDTPSELQFRDLWTHQWSQMLSELLPGFDPVLDVLNLSASLNHVDLVKLLEYKTVIWFALVPVDGSTAFHQFAITKHLDWLEAYQEGGGNLLLTGPGVTTALWSGPLPDIEFPIIVNGTDPYGTYPPTAWFTRADGREFDFERNQQAYRSWCLETMDQVRPPGVSSRIGEEPGGMPTSELACDYLFRAEVASEFLARYPSAAGLVGDLETSWTGLRVPDPEVNPQFPRDLAFYKYAWEEFYNRSIIHISPITIEPRECQVPMFVHRAARDEIFPPGHQRAGEALVTDPSENCSPGGLERSTLDGATNAVVSSVYSETKPLPGSHDFLWGFHPLAFNLETVKPALAWILREDWGLDVTQ